MLPRGVALTLAALSVASALAPLAAADHVYSHRYVLRGRVIDADGQPVAGLGIPYGFTGFTGDEACSGAPQSGVTDLNGDFSYCFHLHEIDAADEIAIRVRGEEHRERLDLDTRATTFLVQVNDSRAGHAPPAGFHSVYRVDGKVWQRTAPGCLDGVYATGYAVPNAAVTLTAVDDLGRLVWENATSDAYGEYRARLEWPTNVTGGSFTVAALGESRNFTLDATMMRGRADVKLDGNATDARMTPCAPQESKPRPPRAIANFPDNDVQLNQVGSETPAFQGPAAYFAVAAVAAGSAGLVTFALARRKR